MRKNQFPITCLSRNPETIYISENFMPSKSKQRGRGINDQEEVSTMLLLHKVPLVSPNLALRLLPIQISEN